MNLVTIFTGVLMEWTYSPLVGVLRNLRLVIMLFLLMRLSNRIRSHLGIMTLITTIIVVLAGIIISQANSTLRLVPSGMVCGIHGSPSHIPVTETSSRRPLLDVWGGILIFLGVVLATVFTASLSAFLIGAMCGESCVMSKRPIKNQNR